MASYKHGVYTSETSTSLVPTTTVLSAVPFVVGIAPINTATDPQVQKPVLCYSYAEAVAAFGFEGAKASGDIKKFTYSLSEVMYTTFSLYGNTPVVLVNVLNPNKHKKSSGITQLILDASKGSGTIKVTGLLADTLKIIKEGDTAYVAGTDYVTAFDDDGYLVVSSLTSDSGFILPTATELTISVDQIDPSAVTSADIIGGVDSATGNNLGLELIADVFPRTGVIPTIIMAPGYSQDPEVASVMAAKGLNINGHFNAIALVDANTTTVTKYSDVPSWKNTNNIALTNEILCWPKVQNGTTVYHMSTHLASLLATTDDNRGGVPYVSPSNKSITITGLCLDDGTEVVIGNEQANYLNGNGILTCLNFIGAWKAWGNRTAVYPGNTDPKDAFIPVRRMFYWVADTITTTIWQKVDEPGNKRLIDSIVDSLNVWLNSLTARQQLLGGRIEFREEDNSTTDLMDGKYHFKVFLTPPSPAEDVEFDLEIDTDYYSTLFD